MNDEMKRFLASINCESDAFKDTTVTKVILNRKDESFDVY